MADALDTLKLGVILADVDCKILHANRAAETMMRDGSAVRDGGGRLHAGEASAAAEIKEAIGYAAHNESQIGKSGLSVRLTEEAAAPVIAHVLPLARGEVRTRLDPSAVAAVFINPARDDESRVRAVSAAFGLTRAETRVLTRILSGRNLGETAADLGISPTTVRSHLDNIFSKTCVSRQSELILLAANISPITF